MGDEEATCDEDEESSYLVADEEDVARVEDDVVEEIGEEVGDAEIEDGFLSGGVGGGEGEA